MTRNHIGVDLSKDALDVFDPCRGETRISNQPKAIARWAAASVRTTSWFRGDERLRPVRCVACSRRPAATSSG